MKNAVKTFSQALSAPEIFPVEDRLKMAQYLSDGGDKETAIQVLSKILESDPANKRARTLLVKEKKLNVSDIASLVRFAIEKGIGIEDS